MPLSPTPLAEAAQAMQLLADSRVIGMFKTRERCFIWANPAFAAMLGYAENELIGQPTRRVYTDEETYRELGQLLYASDGAGEVARTAEFVRKDGSKGRYFVNARRLGDTDDALIGLCIDVTQIKALEETLRRSNDHLELALSSSGTGTWSYDFAEDRFRMDRRTAAIFGFRDESVEVSMQGWLDLIHPEDLPRVEALMTSHFSGDSQYLTLEYRARHGQGGHWIHLVTQGKVTWGPNGELMFGAGIVRDVSDIKRMEQEGADLLHKIERLLRDFSQRNEPNRLAPAVATPRKTVSLSPRHREILELIATGLTSSQIAERLNISHATVLTHRRNLLRKLNLHSIAELTRYALEHRIIAG